MSELTTRAEREQRRNDELSGKMHPASWPDEFVVRLCDHVDALEADNAKQSDVIAALRRRLGDAYKVLLDADERHYADEQTLQNLERLYNIERVKVSLLSKHGKYRLLFTHGGLWRILDDEEETEIASYDPNLAFDALIEAVGMDALLAGMPEAAGGRE